jgi:Protein of unknown function with PCYCGC motif
VQKRTLLKVFGGVVAAVALPRLGRATTLRGPIAAADVGRLRGGETRPILDGRYFAGRTGEAYRAAAEIPDLLDQLYCYCECERSIGHKSLKSCFTDLHGANCGVCQNEALLAWSLNKKGWPVLRIRKEIDRMYLGR